MSNLTLAEETPHQSHLWPGTLMKLNPRSSYNFKDEMEVFSPLADVQPITPSLDKFWDDQEGLKKDNLSVDKKPSSLLFPSSIRRFPFQEDGINDHPIFDWKSSSTSRQVCYSRGYLQYAYLILSLIMEKRRCMQCMKYLLFLPVFVFYLIFMTFQFDGIRLVSFILPLFHVHWKILAYAPSIMPNIWNINELFHQNQLLNYIFSTT
jgi:hypothetical protein